MERRKTLLAAWLTAFGLLAVAQMAGAQDTGNAVQALGMLEVSVQVDGLSCPFCAYGLEKKLRNVENVARLEIQVNEGRAVVTPESGTSLDLDALQQAVRDGGFTPRQLSLSARGRLTELNGSPALELPDGVVVLLGEGDGTDGLLRSAQEGRQNGSLVSVQGRLTKEQPPGHAGHPYTLTVLSFAIA